MWTYVYRVPTKQTYVFTVSNKRTSVHTVATELISVHTVATVAIFFCDIFFNASAKGTCVFTKYICPLNIQSAHKDSSNELQKGGEGSLGVRTTVPPFLGDPKLYKEWVGGGGGCDVMCHINVSYPNTFSVFHPPLFLKFSIRP